MAEVLKSPWVPAIGIVLAWGSYAALRPSRAPEATEAPRRQAAPPHPRPAAPRPERKPAPPRPRTEAPGPAAEETEATPEERPPATGDPVEDEFLDILAQGVAETVSGLWRFIEAHPDHAAARAIFALGLLRDEGFDAGEVREQAEKLRELAPEKGLPDLILARLEGLAGRPDLARQHLLDAVAKELDWFPDSDAMFRRMQKDLEAGVLPMKAASRLSSWVVYSGPFCRALVDQFLSETDAVGQRVPIAPPDDPAALDAHRGTARAIFAMGKAMEERGNIYIENLIGASMMGASSAALEKAGDIGPEERAARDLLKTVRAESRVFVDAMGEIFSDREAALEFMRDMTERGERIAGRRAMLRILSTRTSE